MLNEYLYEIISLIIVLTVFIIYKLNKNSKSTKKSSIESISVKDNIIEDVYDSIIEEKIVSTINEEVIEEEITTKKTTEVKKASIVKRNVPSHGKITKNSFKEFSGKRILVAEDNLINQKVIAGLFAGSGVEIVMANNGQEALEILEQDQNFTIILMDAHMPIIDGFEATRAIRENKNYSDIVVVALSGDTASDDIKKMSEAGMQEHLEKPLRMSSLYDILYAYTGNQKKQTAKEHVDAVMTSELNGDKGLETCGGDEAFYLEILNEFVDTYATSAQQLDNFMKEDKKIEADRLLLDIIGITANIGAQTLEEISKILKEAIQDIEEKSYITILEQYKEHLEALLKDIHNYKNL